MGEIKYSVSKPYMPDKDAFMRHAEKIWENRWLTHGGPLTEEFQGALCKKLKVPHTVVFANGHLALDCALKALDLHDGEAITTPFTYLSTSNALSMNGLKPVFCDIKPSDCTIDETKIEPLITERTKVIVPVHVYGFPCNHKAIQDIADRHNLKVIYDAAHVFGVEVDGQGIGCLGNASMFSFHATKVFHTVEGGAVSFNDPALKTKLVSAKNFGFIAAEEADSISLNAKMTELHAAMGLANLEIIDEQIIRRRQLVEHYLENLSDVDDLELFHWNNPSVKYNYAYFPIRVKHSSPTARDELVSRLQQEFGIQARRYFFPLISDLACYRAEHNSSDTPVAKDISDRVVTLPLYVDLTFDQIDFICGAIRTILQR